MASSMDHGCMIKGIPVSQDHITGSGLELMELTADQLLVFDWTMCSCQVRLFIRAAFLGRQIFFTSFVFCSVRLLKLETMPNNVNETSPQSYKTKN